jgi:hypothetical protein
VYQVQYGLLPRRRSHRSGMHACLAESTSEFVIEPPRPRLVPPSDPKFASRHIALILDIAITGPARPFASSKYTVDRAIHDDLMLPSRDDDTIPSRTRHQRSIHLSYGTHASVSPSASAMIRYGGEPRLFSRLPARSEGWLQTPFYRSTFFWLRLR